MARSVSTQLTLAAAGPVTAALGKFARDAYQIVVSPPAVLAEVDVAAQFHVGNGVWVFYDATNFAAGIDNYKVFDVRGTDFRIGRRAGTVPAADRVFQVVKRVAGTGG